MSSFVVLFNGRRATVKTTPAMTLGQVLQRACETFKLQPSQYQLSFRNKPLDLSLSVRLSGIPSRATLDLEKQKGAANRGNVQVRVALQLPSGGRLQESFPASTTYWEILRHFESKQPDQLNLTRVTGASSDDVGSKRKKTPTTESFYMQPVVNVLSTEINTNKDLMTHSLLSTGISDSVLIRLLFRPTNRTLEEVQHESEVVLQALNEQEAARKANEEEERKRKAEEEEKKKILSSSDSASLPTESTVAQVNMGTGKEKEKDKEVEAAETRTEMEMETRDIPKEEKEKRTEAKGKAKMNTEEHAQQSQQQETITPEPTTMGEEMDVEVLQAFQQGADIRQKEREVADLIRKKKELERRREEEAWKKNIPERDTKVFAPSDRPFSLKDFEVPDHFFEALPSDFAASDRARRQKEETAGMLKTREQREKERLQHVKKFSKTFVRIRFPNRLELQATFHPNESTTAVMEFVQEQLAHPDIPFYLFTTPPRQKVDLKQSLKAQLFVPAAVLHFAWDSPTGPEDYLKPELMANICENLSSYSSSSSSSSSSTSSTGEDASSSSSSGEGSSSSRPTNKEQQTQKLRSWLKLGKKLNK